MLVYSECGNTKITMIRCYILSRQEHSLKERIKNDKSQIN